ncbi:MAG: nucleotidyltransferase family protein [Clostridiales bacterium]|jgi:glucose-1-phosphate thymidylyltransferase|nr:nucleotidyltransferase family protein [Clostridiales bacterium]
MKAIILVAGYATRLYPLTLNLPKALLPIGGKPILETIIEHVGAVSAIDGIYAVSNHKFAGHFEKWAETSPIPVKVLDDGTTSEENRRGAIGDIAFVMEQENLDDDTVIIAGDNYFTFSLQNYYQYFLDKNSDCVCVRQIADREELKQLGVAVLDADGRLLRMVEKPADPPSDYAVFATYMYKKETMQMIHAYLREGNKPDAPGNFVQWLCQRKPVYAFHMDGDCFDIGTPAAYEEVQQWVKKA